MTVLIDSYGFIEYFTNGPKAGKYADAVENASPNDCITPTVVVYEVYKRIKSKYGLEKALQAHAHITLHTRIVPLTVEISLDAAETSLQEGLGMADSIVLATARYYNATIVTGDQHMRGKNGVDYI
ncbi:MAG: type II toxin-antitoxin system VapC family toxin [Candidatus Altiarchaeota archaeon]